MMSVQDHKPSRPDWLDDEFVKTCIKNDVGASSIDDIDIDDVQIQYVVPKGENYASVILRLVANGVRFNSQKQSNGRIANGSTTYQNGSGNGPTNEKRYIVKLPQADGDVAVLLNVFNAFPREIDMYRNIMPQCHDILKDAGLDTIFSCRCVHFLNDKEIFVMEDLGVEKYTLANRRTGADLDHTKLLIRKLARLHGASMKYYEETKYKGVPSFYYEGMIRHIEDEKIREIIDPLFGRTMVTGKAKDLAEDVRSRTGYQNEADILDKLTVHAFDMLCDMYEHKPGSIFNSHLHGDCWLNNMLFKYDETGNPIDVILLDLQLGYINSIGNEFMYFFLTSTSDDVRKHNYHDVVNYYYDNFTETIKKVGYKGIVPTLEQLHEELVKKSVLFLLTSYMLTVMKADLGSEASDRSKADAVSWDGLNQLANNNRKNPLYLKTLFATVDLLKEIGSFKYFEDVLKKLTN